MFCFCSSSAQSPDQKWLDYNGDAVFLYSHSVWQFIRSALFLDFDFCLFLGSGFCKVLSENSGRRDSFVNSDVADKWAYLRVELLQYM